MARLGKTIANLTQYRHDWTKLLNLATQNVAPAAPAGPDLLSEVTGFGSNPGNLRMFTHVPGTLPDAPALVVVLHGCGQTASGYDWGAGWSTLADRHGFALLLPEQQAANNPKTCFNWFVPAHTQRDQGEALSIRQMIERMIVDHGIDRRRVFVTGLSAGGAMASVMLATYPEVFAGGAIVAGLPYGAAGSVQEAFESMFQGRTRTAKEWGDRVRAASPHAGPWPRISVWHGSEDATVKPMNAREIIKQWTNVHALAQRPSRQETVDGYPRRVWQDAAGTEIIEEFTITGMAHGTPLEAGDGENSLGAAGPFLLDVGISSSAHIAKFWGLVDKAAVRPRARAASLSTDVRPAPAPFTPEEKAETQPRRRAASSTGLPIDIGGVINKALRAAGLMK